MSGRTRGDELRDEKLNDLEFRAAYERKKAKIERQYNRWWWNVAPWWERKRGRL